MTISTIPFRAGREGGLARGPGISLDLAARKIIVPDESTGLMLPLLATPKTYLADISEFQMNIIDQQYVNWSLAIIIRAMYGDAHDDLAWYNGQRRDLLHQYGIKFLGIYQYLVASQDAASQAIMLAALVGPLRQGEVLVCDLEEGGGNQATRYETWRNTLISYYQFHYRQDISLAIWDYSGLNFAAAHGLAPVNWVADYTSVEPTVKHTIWQLTDALSIPGIGTCDCSVYDGTIDQLAALAFQPSQQKGTSVKVTELPPGDWKPGGPLILIGPGPQGNDTYETVYDGTSWSTPVKK